MIGDIKIKARGGPSLDPLGGYQLWVLEYDRAGQMIGYGDQLIMKRGTPESFGHNLIPPLVTLPHEAMQELANELWECGIRPYQSRQGHGQLGATERHLADMKLLLFNQLKIKEKK